MSDHVSMKCPHCHKATEVTRAQVPVPNTLKGHGPFYAQYELHGHLWWIGICNACRRVVLVLGKGAQVYPSPRPSPSDERIPEHIRRDLDEAKLCFSVGAFRGTASMARRALQSACILKGAPKQAKLWKQIDWMRDQALITEDMRTWAHEIRYVGNDGAHPPEDPDDPVATVADAENVLQLTEQMLDVLFVTPAIADEQRQKRLAAKTG